RRPAEILLSQGGQRRRTTQGLFRAGGLRLGQGKSVRDQARPRGAGGDAFVDLRWRVNGYIGHVPCWSAPLAPCCFHAAVYGACHNWTHIKARRANLMAACVKTSRVYGNSMSPETRLSAD